MAGTGVEMPQHDYAVDVTWTGDEGRGTASYSAYSRDHAIDVTGRPTILGSSDPAFRGDESRHSPEDLLVASLAACHMLWYLHLCSENGVVVTAYRDAATGSMQTGGSGGGQFTLVVLRPTVGVADPDMVEAAEQLHELAHERCFIANSMNFPVRHEPTVQVASA